MYLPWILFGCATGRFVQASPPALRPETRKVKQQQLAGTPTHSVVPVVPLLAAAREEKANAAISPLSGRATDRVTSPSRTRPGNNNVAVYPD